MNLTGFFSLLMVLLPLFAIPQKAGGQPAAALTPVVATQESRGGNLTCYLLGGWSKGGWLQDQAAARLLTGGETYRFYSLNGELGETVGKPAASLGEPCTQTLGVAFANAPASDGGLVGVGGTFNALPRQPKLLPTDMKVYLEAAADILRKKGIPNPQVKLTQVIQVDLEGDGKDEVLVSATYYAEGLSSRAAPGDYSFIFLRRLSPDTVQTKIIEGDFFPRGVKFGAPGEHRVGAVLDLNGHGAMAIVVFSRYYEGDWVSVYRVKRGKVVKLFAAGCGA